MTPSFREAVLAQPENLEAGARGLGDALREADLGPARSGTLVFSGIGASAHALIPTVLTLRAAGRHAFIVAPGELARPGAAGLADAFVLVSQSGASSETVAALEQLHGAPVIAISAREDSPLARAAATWLPLGPRPDTPVATLSYTSTLQALGMLCAALGGGNDTRLGWEQLPAQAERVLSSLDLLTESLAERFAGVSALDAVGAGHGHAAAGESALLAREALRIPACGMETREYLHGPMEAAEAGLGCIVFGREREHALASDLASFGAVVALISDVAGSGARAGVLSLPAAGEVTLPILQILPVQLLVDHVARRRGLTIGELRRQQPDTKVA